MTRVSIIKQMRPRIPIVKNRERTPTIPSRNIPCISNRARKRTSRDTQEEMTPNHDPVIYRALEIKRQIVNHLRYLLVALGKCPFMRHFPAPRLAGCHKFLDLFLISACKIDERLLLAGLPIHSPCLIQSVKVNL
jgi:hypothetical protein